MYHCYYSTENRILVMLKCKLFLLVISYIILVTCLFVSQEFRIYIIYSVASFFFLNVSLFLCLQLLLYDSEQKLPPESILDSRDKQADELNWVNRYNTLIQYLLASLLEVVFNVGCQYAHIWTKCNSFSVPTTGTSLVSVMHQSAFWCAIKKVHLQWCNPWDKVSVTACLWTVG